MDAEGGSNFLEAEEPTANQSEGAGVLDTAKGKAAIFCTQTGNVGLLWANDFRIGAGGRHNSPQSAVEDPFELVEPRPCFQVGPEEVVHAGLRKSLKHEES